MFVPQTQPSAKPNVPGQQEIKIPADLFTPHFRNSGPVHIRAEIPRYRQYVDPSTFVDCTVCDHMTPPPNRQHRTWPQRPHSLNVHILCGTYQCCNQLMFVSHTSMTTPNPFGSAPAPAASSAAEAGPSVSPPRRSNRRKFQPSPYGADTTYADLDGSRSSLALWVGTPNRNGKAAKQ